MIRDLIPGTVTVTFIYLILAVKKDGETVLDRSENVKLLEGRASGNADLFIDLGFNRFS